MKPVHTISPEIRERLRHRPNLWWDISRDTSRRKSRAIALAQRGFEVLAEAALLLESHSIDLSGAWASVPTRLSEANVPSPIVEAARGVTTEIANFMTLPEVDDASTLTQPELEALIARNYRLPDAVEHFRIAVESEVRRRHVQLRAGDWVRTVAGTVEGEVLAVGPGLLARIQFTHEASSQHCRAALAEFERIERPQPAQLITPGLLKLREARAERDEMAAPPGKSIFPIHGFLERATEVLVAEVIPELWTTNPRELPNDLEGPGRKIRSELLALSADYDDLYPQYGRYGRRLPEDVRVAIVTRLNDLLAPLIELVECGIERRLPARVFFAPKGEPGLLRIEGGRWLVDLGTTGSTHPASLDDLMLPGTLPPPESSDDEEDDDYEYDPYDDRE